MSKYLNLLDDTKVRIGLATGAVVATVGLLWLHKKHQNNLPPKRWRRVGELSELICYPIKSCASIAINAIDCNQLGLEDGHLKDRIFMVTTPDRKYVSGRAYPRLVLVQPKIVDDNLVMSAPGMTDFTLNIPQIGAEQTVAQTKLFDQHVETIDCGDEAAKWLSRFIVAADEGLRLVYYPRNVPSRDVPPENRIYKALTNDDMGALHDETSFMLLNDASIGWLNEKLENVVTAVQFRPNFVVKGANALEEDGWNWIRIGNDAVFRIVQPCKRCVFTNVDPATGNRNPVKEPLSTLRKYRTIGEGGPTMGIHLGIRTAGRVAIGDDVYVEA